MIPTWLPPIVRAALAVVVIVVGASGWADGYGAALVAIGTGLLGTELAGYGVSTAQIAALEAQIETYAAKFGPPPSQPPTAPLTTP